ncbi:hypothetical protein BX600DRAFT_444268 [Xylariales sp. PMI_506]|nr:hypothetical protein BX600DRAFT_444268 [Xylariales sp. PMI_506]
MVWTQVSDSRWERPVDGLEGYFIVMANMSGPFCNGREHYTLFSKLKLECEVSTDIENALRHAWKQLRYEQPQLATYTDGMKKVYEVPDDAALEEWLDSTFVVSSAPNAEELYQSAGGVKQATLYYLPRSSELAFRGHHHTIDGVGILMFWDCYLKALAKPMANISFGDEAIRLRPVMEEIFGYPEQPTPAQAQEVGDLFMSWAGSIPGVGPVSKLGSASPGQCRSKELVVTADRTTSIVRACKAKGVTVTSAIHAAYVMAVTKHADPASKSLPYVTANQFNLRRYLPDPYSTSQSAVSVYYMPVPFKLAQPFSFAEAASELNQYYKNTVENNSRALLELKGHFTRVLCGAVQTPEFLSTPPSRDALVSSLGIVEQFLQQEYGGFKITDVHMGVDVALGMSMFMFYTFRDRLRLSYSFNDGFEEPASIQTYLEEVEAILSNELGV